MSTLNQNEFVCGDIKAPLPKLLWVQAELMAVQPELVAVQADLAASRVKHNYEPIFDKVQEEAYRQELVARCDAFTELKKENTALSLAMYQLALAKAELHRDQTIASAVWNIYKL
jgi:hypothetical protein